MLANNRDVGVTFVVVLRKGVEIPNSLLTTSTIPEEEEFTFSSRG